MAAAGGVINNAARTLILLYSPPSQFVIEKGAESARQKRGE